MISAQCFEFYNKCRLTARGEPRTLLDDEVQNCNTLAVTELSTCLSGDLESRHVSRLMMTDELVLGYQRLQRMSLGVVGSQEAELVSVAEKCFREALKAQEPRYDSKMTRDELVVEANRECHALELLVVKEQSSRTRKPKTMT